MPRRVRNATKLPSFCWRPGLWRPLCVWGRAGARPDLARIGTPRALWKFRLTECPEHLLHDLLALLVAGGVGEERQEGVERILCLREAEPPRIQAERRAGLIH